MGIRHRWAASPAPSPSPATSPKKALPPRKTKNASKKPPHVSLAKKLPLNPHFPVDEVELLPADIITEAKSGFKYSAASTTIDQITCNSDSTKDLVAYCDKVALAVRSVKRVTIKVVSTSINAKKAETVVEHLKQLFSGKGVTAHTLVLQHAPTLLVCEVARAKFSGLTRLVLEASPKVDFDQLFPLIAGNKFLEEVSFCGGTMSGKTVQLARKCSHVTFLEEPSDLSAPPPEAAKKLLHATPLEEPLKMADFLKLRKEHSKAKAPIGLLTAYGTVVPVGTKFIPRFKLVKDMLEENDGEPLIPMEMDPPAGKDALALAVHFVTHYVSDEVEKECEKAEGQGGSDAATGGSKKGKKKDKVKKADLPASSYSWCSEFDQFRTLHIQQRYATSERRLQVMCELMALAAYLNCPSLKRFLRAALVMEETSASGQSGKGKGRGKRNRDNE